MSLKTIADVKLTGRALVSGWLDKCDARKSQAVHDLFDVIENSADDEMKVKAFDALVRADKADVKREELALKKQALDDQRRLQLLAIIKHLPTGELAKIASDHKAAAAE